MRKLTILEEFVLIEMLRYNKYSPELFKSFAGTTANAMWYPVLERIYLKGLGALDAEPSKRENIEGWIEADNGRIEELFEGYLSHYFQVSNLLKYLKIETPIRQL